MDVFFETRCRLCSISTALLLNSQTVYNMTNWLPFGRFCGTVCYSRVGMLIPGYFESRDPNRQSRVATGTRKGRNRRTYGEWAKLTYGSHDEYLNFKYMLLL